eukprot:scaffold3363_cov285-Prasinococcus_capsulatus_cf.AAC.1
MHARPSGRWGAQSGTARGAAAAQRRDRRWPRPALRARHRNQPASPADVRGEGVRAPRVAAERRTRPANADGVAPGAGPRARCTRRRRMRRRRTERRAPCAPRRASRVPGGCCLRSRRAAAATAPSASSARRCAAAPWERVRGRRDGGLLLLLLLWALRLTRAPGARPQGRPAAANDAEQAAPGAGDGAAGGGRACGGRGRDGGGAVGRL